MTAGPPVGWGLLSTARINTPTIAAAGQSERAEIVAVASRDAGRAEAYAREHGIARAHGSYDALLADPAVEAVYVSTPNSLHVDWSVRALEAGKHVLCEKPLGRRPEDVERAFDAADAAGRLLMEAFMYRHHPQTRRLEAIVASGAIGTPRHLRAAFGFALTNTADIRLQPDLDGGALMDVGCYCVSGARLVAGEPTRVVARQVTGSSGVDVRLAALLEFPAEMAAVLTCGFDAAAFGGLEVVGSQGSVLAPDPWRCRTPSLILHRPDGAEVERIEIERVDHYRLQLENASDAIRGRAEPLLGREDALGQARAIEALYTSAARGEAVEL